MTTLTKPKKKITRKVNKLTGLMPADANSKKLLDERAKVIAAVEKDNHELEDLTIEYVKFVIGSNEQYGIPYHDIQDIKQLEHITKVPMTPAYVTGITYWHGKLIPVIDLASYLGMAVDKSKNKTPYVATIMLDKLIIALCFDDVVGVASYLEENLDKNVTTNKKILESYVYGIDAGRTTILNVQNIIKDISAELMNERSKRHE